MEVLTINNLVLARDAAIDLQMHTTLSDGTWTPEALMDHLVAEGFGLVAITDHERTDTVAFWQQLGAKKGLPVLVAVEMTARWRGEYTDVLCFGFVGEENELSKLAQDIIRRQEEAIRVVYENLCRKGLVFADGDLAIILTSPSAQQPADLMALLDKYGYSTKEVSAYQMLVDAGFQWTTCEIADACEAAHRSGAMCLLAHPGRGSGWLRFDETLLDELHQEVPIDGLEVYYPAHTPEQINSYLEYAKQHDLLVSAGSDSHGPDKKPIKYQAELCQKLLARLGIRVEDAGAKSGSITK
jgi:predicted metal-dependent phosphoesterase TrpH